MKRILRSVLSIFLTVAMLSGYVGLLAQKTHAYSYIAYGIDVSAWQGDINWTQVKASGIDFAILRVMASGKDKYFETNYNNAKAAGVKLGAYIYSYADTVAEAQTEAQKVLSYINGRTLEYPVYYDIEDPDRHAGLSKAQRTALCTAFCDVIQASGYRAGIYSTTYWFDNYMDRAALSSKYEIWEAKWPTSGGVQVKEPIYDKSATCGMWQYTSQGSIPGISGYVDRNVSYKDYASYMAANGLNGYGNGTVTPPVTPSVCNPNSYYQTTATVNFRSGPSTSDGVIASIGAGTQVAVTAFNGDNTWAQAVYNGAVGWISTSYLTYIRAFAYGLHYLTNNTTSMASASFQYGSSVKLGTPAADVEGATLKGMQLLRLSDFTWYTGSGWSANQADAKLFFPNDTITFNSAMINPLAGDDNFYLGVVWGSSSPSTPSVPETPSTPVTPVTPSNTSPKKWGWIWSANEAYGFMGNYGGNGQDIELSVDLALLPSSDGKTSCAAFYTDYTDRKMTITPTTVTVGNTSVSYNWGSVSLNNWHNVKFKVNNGKGYVFIDGALIASESGFTANTDYQLLFAHEGQMAIDNAVLTSSDGKVYFSCDFEDKAQAEKLMGTGLGHRELLFPDKSNFDVNIYAPETSVFGTGSVTFTATPTAGEGHSYSWSSSDGNLESFMYEDGNTLTIDIPYDLGVSLYSAITCSVESDGGVRSESSVSFSYTPYPVADTEPAPPADTTVPEGEDTAVISSEPAWDMSTGLYEAFELGSTYTWANNVLAYSHGGDSTRLTVTETSADPYTTLAVHTAHALRSENNYLLITYTLPVGSDIRYFEAYFTTSDDPNAANVNHNDTARIYSEALVADGKKHAVVLDLTSIQGVAPFEAAYLSLLRIDLLGAYNGVDTVQYDAIGAGSYIDVESVAFCSTHYEACRYANEKGLSAFPVKYELYFVYDYEGGDPNGTPLFDTVSQTESLSNHILNPTINIFPQPSQLKEGYVFAGWSYVVSNNITTTNVYGTVPAGETALTIDGAVADELLSAGKNEYSQTLYCRFDPIWVLPEPVYPEIISVTPSLSEITDKGTAQYTINAEGEGLTYLWTCSDERLLPYLSGTDTATLSVDIDELLWESIDASFTCTVTNADRNSVTSSPVNLTYVLTPPPAVEAVTPVSDVITDTGSASYTVAASGRDLTYQWTCSDESLLPYLSGADTDTLTVSIDAPLANELYCEFFCTVTDVYGRAVTGMSVVLEYKLTPEPEPEPDPEPEPEPEPDPEPEPEPEYIYGDLNGDGVVNAMDVNIAKRILSGSVTPTPQQNIAGDLNGDGSFNGVDSNFLVRIVSGQ